MTATAPKLDPIIEAMDRKRLAGYTDPFRADSGPEARRQAWAIRNDLYPSPRIEVASVEEGAVPSPAGPVRIRILRPSTVSSDATLVYFHGGGWMVGDLDSHHAHAARLANRAGAVVINVDYRLAPEHPFPAAVEDAIAALTWASAHVGALGRNPAKLAVAGDSSGGNLAAVCALHARDRGIPLVAQLLIYPATDLRLRASKPGPNDLKYMGADCVEISRDWRASPAAASLRGAAPAIIGTGIHDYLHEDNMAYAALLRAAGVPVQLRVFDTLNHGFFSYTGVSPVAEAAANLLCEDLRQLLHDAG